MFQKPYKNYLQVVCDHPYVLIFLFFSIHFVARVSSSDVVLGLDEAEAFYHASTLSIGYPRQLPLYNWIQHVFFRVFSSNLLSISLLKNLLLAGASCLFFASCNLIFNNKRIAWSCLLSWVLIFQISYECFRALSHTCMALFSVNLLFYSIVLSLKSEKTLKPSIQLMLIISFISCLLSKYNSWLFILCSMVSLTFLLKKRNPKLLLTFYKCLLLAFIIISPFIYWFLNHLDLALSSTQKVFRKEYSIKLILEPWISMAVFLSPMIVISFIKYLSRGKESKNSEQKDDIIVKLDEKIVKFIVYYLITLISTVLILWIIHFGHLKMKDRHFTPLLFLLPVIFWGLKDNITLKDNMLTFYNKVTIVVLSLIFIFLMLTNKLLANQNNYPINSFLASIKTSGFQLDHIVSDDQWLLANICFNWKNMDCHLINNVIERFHTYEVKPNTLVVWRARKIYGSQFLRTYINDNDHVKYYALPYNSWIPSKKRAVISYVFVS